MTEKRRIFLNVVATYGRSLYALLCGLFTSRWVLKALGHEGYGIIGIVGGLMILITYVNSWLSASISRFYAFAVGQTQANPKEGLEECRKWFSIAVLIHTAIPCLLILIGYPLGVWAIQHFLEIPPGRELATLWVFRFACISCFIGMLNVPFNAMYVAKQYIAELTIYSFVTTTLNVIVLYYMVTHPGDWLTRYAAWTCFVSAVPQIIIALRAMVVFPECRFRFKYCRNRKAIKELYAFAGWQFFGSFGWTLRSQGFAILINKYFGVRVNAAMTVANNVSAQTNTLASALMGAFSPAIVSAYGAGDLPRMRSLTYQSSRFAALLNLFFLLPLSVELPEIIRLWLETPPPYTIGLCYCVLTALLADAATSGFGIAVSATGQISKFQLSFGLVHLMAIPVAWFFLWAGYNVYAIGILVIVAGVLHGLIRVFFARQKAQISAKHWIRGTVVPCAFLIGVCCSIGLLPHLFLEASIVRILLSLSLTTLVFLPLVWFVIFTPLERIFICEKMLSRIPVVKNFARRYLNP